MVKSDDYDPRADITSAGLGPRPIPDRCPACGNHGIDEWHLNRCAYLADLRARVEQRAEQLDIDPVLARNLFAHMRVVSDDGNHALHRAIAVMDLGWRPVVPSGGVS